MIWIIMNRIKAISPRKWRLLAGCLPPKIFWYLGNRAAIAGDIAAPVAIMKGPRIKTTAKYVSSCSGLYGFPGGGICKLAYIMAMRMASGMTDHEVGTSRCHSL